MKILPRSKFRNFKSAINLTPRCEGSSIMKINENTFAFCDEDARRPFLIIESTIFSLLMIRLGDRIAHYKVFRPKCLCCDESGDMVIRITETDGFVYQIGENEKIEMCMDLEKVYNEEYERD